MTLDDVFLFVTTVVTFFENVSTILAPSSFAIYLNKTAGSVPSLVPCSKSKYKVSPANNSDSFCYWALFPSSIVPTGESDPLCYYLSLLFTLGLHVYSRWFRLGYAYCTRRGSYGLEYLNRRLELMFKLVNIFWEDAAIEGLFLLDIFYSCSWVLNRGDSKSPFVCMPKDVWRGIP